VDCCMSLALRIVLGNGRILHKVRVRVNSRIANGQGLSVLLSPVRATPCRGRFRLLLGDVDVSWH